jgi:hypothetical protein
MFGVSFKLLNISRDFIDVGEQAARRLAVEAGSGNDRKVAFDTLGPGA